MLNHAPYCEAWCGEERYWLMLMCNFFGNIDAWANSLQLPQIYTHIYIYIVLFKCDFTAISLRVASWPSLKPLETGFGIEPRATVCFHQRVHGAPIKYHRSLCTFFFFLYWYSNKQSAIDSFILSQAKFRSGANRISTAFWASAVTSPQWKMLTNSKEHTNAEAYNFIQTNLEVPMCS